MAARFWVTGGTGNWNSTTNWSATTGGASGASVPTAADNVIFDQAATYTVTLTGALTCLSITVSAGTVTFSSTGTIAVSGSMSLVAATVWNATGTITFNSTSAGNTITTNGVTLSNSITFNGEGGSWQLQDALTSGPTRTTTLTAGTLDLNDKTLTIGTFNSSNANTRTLAFGDSGFINLTSASITNNVTIFTTSDSTNFTVTGADPLVNVEGGSSGFIRTISTGLISSGGSEANAISFSINSGTDTINLGTAHRVFKDIKFSGFTGNIAADVAPYIYGDFFNNNSVTITGGTNAWVFKATSNAFILSLGRPINNPVIFDGIGGSWFLNDGTVVNGAVTLTNGTLRILSETTFTVGSFATSGTNQKYLQSTTAGAQGTISAASGTNSVSYLTIQDNNATGGATWYATGSTNVDAGNNTGWIFFPTPADSNEITMRLRSFTQPRRF